VRDHHRRAAEKALDRLLEQVPELVAVLVGGSIAKGIEREDSDVDLIVVIPDDAYARRLAENCVSFFWNDLCDYTGGYVEGKLVGRSFIREAAERGSEPTRHAFKGVFPVHCTDDEILKWLSRIPQYPQEQQQNRIDSFLAQFQLNRWFFWGEGVRRGDRYLQVRAATDMVLFGCRLVLACNQMLFPCHKRLIEETLAAPRKPENLQLLIDRFLTELTDEAKKNFCDAIQQFAGTNKTDMLSRFQQDVEMSWYNRVHAVSEW